MLVIVAVGHFSWVVVILYSITNRVVTCFDLGAYSAEREHLSDPRIGLLSFLS